MRLRRRRHERGDTPHRRKEALDMPRTRGLLSGILLMALGAWAAFIPFVGPYFDYSLRGVEAWTWDVDVLWLSILPGVALFAGGLMLATAGNRASGSAGGWLALAGGVWLVIGSSMHVLWDDVFGYGAAQTASTIELLGFFYGTGAAATALAAFALGRMTIRGHRDPGVVDERPVADVERRRRERETADSETAAPTRLPG